MFGLDLYYTIKRCIFYQPIYSIIIQEKRIAQEIAALEKDTGYKLRVLAQNYPDTPGIDATVYLDVSTFDSMNVTRHFPFDFM